MKKITCLILLSALATTSLHTDDSDGEAARLLPPPAPTTSASPPPTSGPGPLLHLPAHVVITMTKNHSAARPHATTVVYECGPACEKACYAGLCSLNAVLCALGCHFGILCPH